MAERRMFAKSIVLSDAFLDMPLGARCLYMTMGMMADDDGFVNNARTIIRITGASDDDLRVLIAKKFIIPFEDGVIVIKHWRINNYLRNDRYQETKYIEYKARLLIDKNGAYSMPNSAVGIPSSGIPSIGKDRLGKDRIDDIASAEAKHKPEKHKYGEYQNVLLTDAEYEKLKKEFSDLPERIERLSEYIASKGIKYKSHYATIKAWARRDREKMDKGGFKQTDMTAQMKEIEDLYLGIGG